MKNTEGCVVALLGLILASALLLMGGAVISRSIADWRHAGAIVQVAEQETERTRILADAAVEIAEIQADATKKTSFAFVAFWSVRALTWVLTFAAGLVWLLVVVKAVNQWTSMD